MATIGVLQWGRERALAETFARATPPVAGLPASMGPRACARGNFSCLSPSCLRRSPLQWGRERALAETRPDCVYLIGPDGLQWGRERALAETRAAATPTGSALLQWGRERALAE